MAFSIDWTDQGLLKTYRSSRMIDFLIHSRLVLNQWVSRSTTTEYLQGWARSNGSMVNALDGEIAR